MSIYSILDILGFIFVMYSLFFRRKYQKRICYIYLLFWTILVSLRGYGVGNDTSGYAYFFSGKVYPSLLFNSYGTLALPDTEIEGAFVWIARVLSFISTSPTFLFSVIAIPFFSAIYYLYKDKIFGGIGLLWLFTSTYSMMNIMYVERQCLSLGILFWGIIFLEKEMEKSEVKIVGYKHFLKQRNAILALCMLILAAFVHKTSAIAVVLYFAIRWMKVRKIYAAIAVLLCVSISLTSVSVIQQYFDMFFALLGGISWNSLDVMARYQDSMETNNISFLNLASFALPCLVTIFFSSKDEIQRRDFKMYITAICMMLLFSSSPFMARFIVVFLILGYSAAIPAFALKNKILLTFYISISVFYLWKMVNLYANWPVKISTDLPYVFFWE